MTTIMEKPQVRIRDGKSQVALAKAMETDQNHISRLEREEVSPTLQTLEKIAAATDHDLQVEFVMRPFVSKKRRR